MMSIFQEPFFTFRFADSRLVPRCHLEGIAEGCSVTVYRLDPTTGETSERLFEAMVGADGWVDLPIPIIVPIGGGFRIVPERSDSPPAPKLNS